MACKQIPPCLYPPRPRGPAPDSPNPLKSALSPLMQAIPELCIRLIQKAPGRRHELLRVWSEPAAPARCQPRACARGPAHSRGLEPRLRGAPGCSPRSGCPGPDPACRSRPARPTFSPEGQAASDTAPHMASPLPRGDCSQGNFPTSRAPARRVRAERGSGGPDSYFGSPCFQPPGCAPSLLLRRPDGGMRALRGP